MPQLPSFENLGGSPSGNSGQVGYNPTEATAGAGSLPGIAGQTGAGLKAFGAGLTSAGTATISYAQEQQDKANKAALTDAKTSYLLSHSNLDGTLEEEDDPSVIRQNYGAAYKTAADVAGQYLTGDQKREFDSWAAPQVQKGFQTSNSRADELTKDSDLAQNFKDLTALRDSGLKTNDPSKIAEIGKTAGEKIDDLVGKGYYTEEQGEKLKNTWTKDFSYSWVGMQPPQKRVMLLGGWEKSLATQESGGNPAKVNQFGYAGTYQFGAPRLADIGEYTPGPNENLSNWSKTSANAPGKWSGTFNIPGFPDVKTFQDFLGNPDAQKAAFAGHISKMDQEIQSNGLDKYIGKTVQGIPITREGLYSMMHLGGAGGAAKALQGQDVRDANGTSVISYARHGLGSVGRDQQIADLMPPDQRQQMLDQSVRESIVHQNQIASAQRDEQANIKSLIDDDHASLMSTGLPVDGLTGNKVGSVLGPQARADFEAGRERAANYFTATSDWDTLPSEQISQRLQGMTPKPGQVGFAEQQSYYDAAQKRAQTIVKQREIDPAAYVDQLPNVKQARQNFNPSDAKSYIPLVKARIAAQTAIGIPPAEQMPITKDEASLLMAPVVQALPGQQWMAMQKVAPFFKQAFGGQSDRAMSFALNQAHIDKQTAQMASYGNIAQSLDDATPMVAPQGVDTAQWAKVVSEPPVAKNGATFAASQWATAVTHLVSDPSPANIQLFNASKFGKAGFDGAKLIEQLTGKKVPNAGGEL